MDARSIISSDVICQVRTPEDRLVRVSPDSPGPSLFLGGSERSTSTGDRCISPELGALGYPSVCVSTTNADPISSSKDTPSACRTNTDNAMVAQSTLVTRIDDNVDTHSLLNTSLAGLDKLRMTAWFISAEPFRNEACQLMWPHSYSPATLKSYTSAWNMWCGWCSRQGLDPATPSTTNLTRYLWYLYSERNYAWSTLGVHRSAISTLLQPLGDKPIGSDYVISLFMRARYMSRPPLRKLNLIWDVGLIFRCLEGWGDVVTLSRSRLTHRLVMLLALASAKRVSDMFLFCVDD